MKSLKGIITGSVGGDPASHTLKFAARRSLFRSVIQTHIIMRWSCLDHWR